MATDPDRTTLHAIVGIRATSRPAVTAGAGPDPIVNASFGDRVALVGSPEDMLAFARALASAVERAVPVELLLGEWVRDEGEAVQP